MAGEGATEKDADDKEPTTLKEQNAPKAIGRYEVERLLGQGGMGRVWLARDTVLGRPVAIKVLRDDLALPPTVRDELVIRMGHEARAAAAVSHPNIVTLYDMGEDAVVGLFLVFEYVTGGERDDAPLSLRDRLKRGALPLGEVAKLAREVGSALSFAHEAGVIHRDVKPENILFSRTGFKIADFGIARIPESTITRANTVLGTPAYTAPEALSKGEFGPASDQFSLAATLYEAATGVRAFGGEDAIATAGKVSSEPPPPMPDILGSQPAVRTLDGALRKGLAKLPADRYASCAVLGHEVARVILAFEQGEGDIEGLKRQRVLAGLPPLVTPVPSILEVERTPLSSRVATVERARTEVVLVGQQGTGDTPRPSILLRQRTHRYQNIAAGVALLVIITLILVGRRTTPSSDDLQGAVSAVTSGGASPLAPPGKQSPRPVGRSGSPSGLHAASSASSARPPEDGGGAASGGRDD